ncbi:SDR family NAD(P)-dependent oxidoreductase [Klebsiella pneumoniae]
MSNLLAGKVAIITGGASGISLAAAQRFVSESACVVIADVAQAAGEAAVTRFSRLDVMFNNAGSTGDSSAITEIGPACKAAGAGGVAVFADKPRVYGNDGA